MSGLPVREASLRCIVEAAVRLGFRLQPSTPASFPAFPAGANASELASPHRGPLA